MYDFSIALRAVMTGDACPSDIGGERSLQQTVLLEAVAETVPDGVLIVSPDGKILHFNQHFLKTWHFPPGDY